MVNKVVLGVFAAVMVVGLGVFIAPALGIVSDLWGLWIAVWIGFGTGLLLLAMLAQSLATSAELRHGYTTLPGTHENADLRDHRTGELLREAGAYYANSDAHVHRGRIPSNAYVRAEDSSERSQRTAILVSAGCALLSAIAGTVWALVRISEQDDPDRASLLLWTSVITALITLATIAGLLAYLYARYRARLRILAIRFPSALFFLGSRNIDLVTALWRTMPETRRSWWPISSTFIVVVSGAGLELWGNRAKLGPTAGIPFRQIRGVYVREIPHLNPPQGGPALVVSTVDDEHFPFRVWTAERIRGAALSGQPLANAAEAISSRISWG